MFFDNKIFAILFVSLFIALNSNLIRAQEGPPTTAIDKKEWTKYRDLTKAYLTLYNEELWIRSIYAELSIKVQSKDDITNIKRQLKTPNEANKEYMYRLYYYNALSLIARYQNDQIGLIETCKKAIAFFSKRTTPLPYTTKFTFQFQLIPIYLKQKKYADAHVIIKSCLVLPSSGSYSWHLTTLYKAVLGFYSGKPIIALNAYLEAQKALKKIIFILVMALNSKGTLY